jgi:hypothetical protein
MVFFVLLLAGPDNSAGPLVPHHLVRTSGGGAGFGNPRRQRLLDVDDRPPLQKICDDHHRLASAREISAEANCG